MSSLSMYPIFFQYMRSRFNVKELILCFLNLTRFTPCSIINGEVLPMNFQKPWCQTKERKKKKFLILTQKENSLPNEKTFYTYLKKTIFHSKKRFWYTRSKKQSNLLCLSKKCLLYQNLLRKCENFYGSICALLKSNTIEKVF